MAVTIKKIALWRGRIENTPGALARVLEPLTAAKADLQVLMGYHEPGQSQSVVELYPVTGARASAAAQRSGLAAAAQPSLLVSGDNRAGVGHRMARALGEAGINISFLVAQATGRKFSMVFGFDNDADAASAAKLIKKAASAKG
jgi:hypothetical protein